VNFVGALDIVNISNENIRFLTFLWFKKRLSETVPPLGVTCPKNKRILTLLCMLYGLSNLTKENRALYECGYFASGQQEYRKLMTGAIKKINLELRPRMVSIMESFNHPDEMLLSAIGNSYGDIYETHLKWAKDSNLNHTKLGDAIPDGFMELMMPVLKAKL